MGATHHPVAGLFLHLFNGGILGNKQAASFELIVFPNTIVGIFPYHLSSDDIPANLQNYAYWFNSLSS